VGSWDGYEYALDAATGTLKWKTFLGQTTAPCYPQLAGVSSVADVENGVVYVGGGDSNWYALDAATGNVLWKVFIGDNTKGWYNWASPLIYNGFAYIGIARDRKSTRLNSSHVKISYAVFCLKKKKLQSYVL